MENKRQVQRDVKAGKPNPEPLRFIHLGILGGHFVKCRWAFGTNYIPIGKWIKCVKCGKSAMTLGYFETVDCLD